VRTDIAGFAGFTERGPLPPPGNPPRDFDWTTVAIKVESWKQFLATFGSFHACGYLAYSVRAFFETGGMTCYVVRVAATTAADPAMCPSTAQFPLPGAAAAAAGVLKTAAVGYALDHTGAPGIQLSPGSLIGIAGTGLLQIDSVVAIAADGMPVLATPLGPGFSPGDKVTVYPSTVLLTAKSAGNWGNALQVNLTPLDAGAFGLRVALDEGVDAVPAEEEFYRRLTLNPADAYYAPKVLAAQSNLLAMTVGENASISFDSPALSGGPIYLQGGRDGLSGLSLRDFMGSSDDLRGLRVLEEIADVSMICAPDAVWDGIPQFKPMVPAPPPCETGPTVVPDPVPSDPTAIPPRLDQASITQLQLAMIDQCERLRYRVAILDTSDRLTATQALAWPDTVRGLSAQYSALYWPWLKTPDALQVDGLTRRIPPSGHVAGTYAATDLTFGVQKPPANLALGFVADVCQPIDDLQQENLNQNSVNAIRAFPGRGIRVWGARSLAAFQDSDWMFIHIRRLMSAVEKTVQVSSRWITFQNNTSALRSTLKHSLDVLLEGIWSQGGLQGQTPAQGFYVKCDDSNNPQSVIDVGQLVCEIGIAAAAPMEFIVFEIRRNVTSSDVVEA
jgi:uncharacterized protein